MQVFYSNDGTLITQMLRNADLRGFLFKINESLLGKVKNLLLICVA